MLDLYLIIDVIVVVALVILGISVLIQNSRSELNRFFALFVASVGVWIIANYISNDISNSPQTAVRANYFVFFFSYLAAIYILCFSISLANDAKARQRFKFVSVPLVLIGLTSFTPLLVQGVELQDNLYAVKFGPAVSLYGLSLVGLIIAALYILKTNLKRATNSHKARIRVIYRSLYLTMPLLLVVQFILPAATGWFGLTNIGILTMLILVFGLYYGTVKHRLFDLRLIVVRSLGYVLALGLISIMYGSASHYIASFVFEKTHNELARTIINILLIAVVALTYAPLKRTFDRITNKFFYRDSYDTQGFLDSFNNVLVSTIEIEPLLKSCADIIETNLKSDFCLFAIRETSYFPQRIIGEKQPAINDTDFNHVRSVIKEIKEKVLVSSYLGDEYAELKDKLQKNDIEVVVRLVATLDYQVEGVGYILLGAKKSGNPYNSQDIGILEIIANELVIAVQNSLRFEEIDNFNVTLQNKVDDATRQLRKTNDKLKALDETKDEFISMASHQLRTPLTSVKGYLSMVLEGDAGELSEMQNKLLNQAFVSSQRMVYLIADLLNVSRLRTGKFIIDAAPTNLAAVIEGEVNQLVETAAARGLELTYKKPANFPTLMMDETKVRQVLMNFIDNAIYYSKSGGHIVVELKETDDTIEYTVTDDGIGVPKSEQPHLFTKFYRADNAKRARPDGTGLGLFMARKVIVAQGGAIIFKSQEGKGSTFGFSFPKAKLALPVITPEAIEAKETAKKSLKSLV